MSHSNRIDAALFLKRLLEAWELVRALGELPQGSAYAGPDSFLGFIHRARVILRGGAEPRPEGMLVAAEAWGVVEDLALHPWGQPLDGERLTQIVERAKAIYARGEEGGAP